MADKKRWTSEYVSDNQTRAHELFNESYSSGVVDNLLETYNVFEGNKISEKEEEEER